MSLQDAWQSLSVTGLTQMHRLSPRADVREVSSQGAAAAASAEELVQEE